jgi:UDP-N-acetylmuramyl pentapeptide phosphotransferase/UDP-N-acetylglucosamine-1-phosphate transferase
MTAIFLASFCASLVLCWPAAFVLRRLGVIDRPNARSSHQVPTVRGGGVAILTTVLGGLGIAVAGGAEGGPGVIVIGAGAALLAVVSFVDDLRSVGAALRFGCHGLVAALFVWKIGLPPGLEGGWAEALLAVVGFLWIAGYTNAFNFMDGINGLAAGQAAVTGLGTAALALAAGLPAGHPACWIGLLVAGAAAGFFPHNFPRARMFMGDVGSAPMGCLLATAGWWLASSAGWWWLVPVGLLHANFVLDTGVTLARRVLRGERWHEAHREHFYQRLIRAGRSHAFVTAWEMAGQALVIALALFAAREGGAGRWGAAVAGATLVWGGWFAFAEREFDGGRRKG